MIGSRWLLALLKMQGRLFLSTLPEWKEPVQDDAITPAPVKTDKAKENTDTMGSSWHRDDKEDTIATAPSRKEDDKEDTQATTPSKAKEKFRKYMAKLLRLFKKKEVVEVPVQEIGFFVERKKQTHTSSSTQESDAAQGGIWTQTGRPTPNSKWKQQEDSSAQVLPNEPAQDRNSSQTGRRGLNSILTHEDHSSARTLARREWILVAVRTKILGDRTRYSTAYINMPLNATYGEFITESQKALRRQSPFPKAAFPRKMLVQGLLADWPEDQLLPSELMPRELTEDNFQGCIMRYSRRVQPDALQVELILSALPTLD